MAATNLPPEQTPADPGAWPVLPTETEIYILPDGRVIVADLPAELVPMLTELGVAAPFGPDHDAGEPT